MHLLLFLPTMHHGSTEFLLPPLQGLNKDNTLKSRKQAMLGMGKGAETGTGGGVIRKARLRRLELQQ